MLGRPTEIEDARHITVNLEHEHIRWLDEVAASQRSNRSAVLRSVSLTSRGQQPLGKRQDSESQPAAASTRDEQQQSLVGPLGRTQFDHACLGHVREG